MRKALVSSLLPHDVTKELLDTIAELGHVERQLLLIQARRVRAGQAQYGVLDLETDRRDWQAEEHEEMLDAATYRSIAALKKRAV